MSNRRLVYGGISGEYHDSHFRFLWIETFCNHVRNTSTKSPYWQKYQRGERKYRQWWIVSKWDSQAIGKRDTVQRRLYKYEWVWNWYELTVHQWKSCQTLSCKGRYVHLLRFHGILRPKCLKWYFLYSIDRKYSMDVVATTELLLPHQGTVGLSIFFANFEKRCRQIQNPRTFTKFSKPFSYGRKFHPRVPNGFELDACSSDAVCVRNFGCFFIDIIFYFQ